jgi:uncharacterized membrane protein YfcA
MALLGLSASLIMGLILGLMGGGGSILTVPILVYLFKVNPDVATGSSLFVVGLTALIGSTSYFKNKLIDFKVTTLFVIPGMMGVSISRLLIMPRIPQVVFQIGQMQISKNILIMALFAVLMILASYSMIQKISFNLFAGFNEKTKNIILIFEGLIVGLISGFIGAGGGFLIIPALVIFVGLAMKRAVGTSLLIISINSLIGFVGFVSQSPELIPWKLLLQIIAMSLLGLGIANFVQQKISETQLKKSFGWFILIMGSIIFLDQLFKSF